LLVAFVVMKEVLQQSFSSRCALGLTLGGRITSGSDFQKPLLGDLARLFRWSFGIGTNPWLALLVVLRAVIEEERANAFRCDLEPKAGQFLVPHDHVAGGRLDVFDVRF